MTGLSVFKAFLLRLSLLVVLVGVHGSALAQGVLQPARTGVLQQLPYADGSSEDVLLISGVRYNFDAEGVEFLLRGEPFEPGMLEVGMVVRFTMRDGQIVRVEVLGPNNLIEGINEH